MSAIKTILNVVLILSHGNAEVERGFSVNKEVTVEHFNGGISCCQKAILPIC